MKAILVVLLAKLLAVSAVWCPEGCSCPAVTFANCSNNRLGQLPNGEFDVRTTDVDLSCNRISSIVENFIGLHVACLVMANFSNNLIGDVDVHAFRTAKDLRQLDLSWNRLSWIHSRAFSIHTFQLEWLSLAGNPRLYLHNSGKFIISLSLTFLDLSHCNISRIPDESFARVPNIRTLDLSHNKLTELNSAILSGLSHLEYLDLSHNQLGLNCIGLHFNAPYNLWSINILDLSNNKLACIDVQFVGNMSSLTSLDLTHNNLDPELGNTHSIVNDAPVELQPLKFNNSSASEMVAALKKHNCVDTTSPAEPDIMKSSNTGQTVQEVGPRSGDIRAESQLNESTLHLGKLIAINTQEQESIYPYRSGYTPNIHMVAFACSVAFLFVMILQLFKVVFERRNKNKGRTSLHSVVSSMFLKCGTDKKYNQQNATEMTPLSCVGEDECNRISAVESCDTDTQDRTVCAVSLEISENVEQDEALVEQMCVVASESLGGHISKCTENIYESRSF